MGLFRRFGRSGSSAPAPQPRFHLIGLGSAKTGTNSLAAIFAAEYRVGHEVDVKELSDLVSRRREATTGQDAIDQVLLDRNHRYRLEVDSNQLNQPFAADYARLFADAQFVFTIREPRSWLDSFFDHRLNDTPSGQWKEVLDREVAETEYASEESALQDLGLPTVSRLLRNWSRGFEHVIGVVPDDRLLVVRTPELRTRIDELAAFVEVDPATLDADASHAFAAPQNHHVLEQLDRDHVDGLIDELCEPWRSQWF